MEGHELMVIFQASPAVAQTIGTVRTWEITWITTLCTVSYLQPFSSIVAKHLLEVSVPICDPFLHDLSTLLLFRFLFSFGVSFGRIIMLYFSLIFNIFGEWVVRFWLFRKQVDSKSSQSGYHRVGRWCLLVIIAMKSDSACHRRFVQHQCIRLLAVLSKPIESICFLLLGFVMKHSRDSCLASTSARPSSSRKEQSKIETRDST